MIVFQSTAGERSKDDVVDATAWVAESDANTRSLSILADGAQDNTMT